MSTKSSFLERFGTRVQVRDVPSVTSGSPGTVVLTAFEPYKVNIPAAFTALVRRGVSAKTAKHAAERAFDGLMAPVEVPRIDCDLAEELGVCGVATRCIDPPHDLDVRAVRDALALSQAEFALTLGLDLASVKNWEQGRARRSAAVRTLLAVIAKNPAAVTASISARQEPLRASAPTPLPLPAKSAEVQTISRDPKRRPR